MTRRELLSKPTWGVVGAALGALSALGCASAPPRPPHAAVELSETLPAGYDSLGVVSAACREHPRARSFRGEPALNFVCGPNELARALVEEANARGGTLLAREGCERAGEEGLVCSAEVARREPPRASPSVPSAEFAGDELLATVASRIRIDLDSARVLARRARSPREVAELVALPVGHVEAGVMRARCSPSECDADQTRAGLRLAAGALGASELVGMRCVSFDGERTCVATLGVPERDPETDPLAR
jgi:hypothetical protein